MKRNKFAEARKLMSKTLKKDEGLYQAYQAHIAMCIYDNLDLCTRANRNIMADKIIKLIFD